MVEGLAAAGLADDAKDGVGVGGVRARQVGQREQRDVQPRLERGQLLRELLLALAVARASARSPPRCPRRAAWPAAISAEAWFFARPQRLELGQQLAAARVERGDLVNRRGEVGAAAGQRGANRVALLADQPQIENGSTPS